MSPRMRVGAFAGAIWLMAVEASAYCRKTTCETCPLDPVTGCPTGGREVAWPGECVSYSLHEDASLQVDLATASTVAAEAFGVWQSVACPGTGSPPSILVTDAVGLARCKQPEFNSSGSNANVVMFHDDEWPRARVGDAAGRTSVTFDAETGDIVNADVEINGTLPLSAEETALPGRYDVLSLLVHEAGHFLGLAHSSDPTATMRPFNDIGTDDFRDLAEDDIAGICAIYPPGRAATPCDFSPYGGFTADCTFGVVEGGCRITRGFGRHTNAATGYVLVALSVALVIRRRHAMASRRAGSSDALSVRPRRREHAQRARRDPHHPAVGSAA